MTVFITTPISNKYPTLNSSPYQRVTFPWYSKDAGIGGITFCCPRWRNKWRALRAFKRALLVIGVFAFLSLLMWPEIALPTTITTSTIKAKATTITSDGRTLCISPECVEASSKIKASMDPSVYPCKDFYQFACGRWVDNLVHQDNQAVMKTILEQPSESLVSEAEKSAQRFYRSCLSMNRRRKSFHQKQMLELVSRIGGWPAIDPAIDGRSWDFQLAIQAAQNLKNNGGLFVWQVRGDAKNSSRYIITIGQIGNALPTWGNHQYLMNNSYINNIKEVGLSLNPYADTNAILDQMQDIMILKSQIAKIAISEIVNRDVGKHYHHLSIAELNKLAPFINWTSYFQSAFSQVNITITPSHMVAVMSPDYLRNVSAIVEGLLTTNGGIATLHNYMAWQLVSTYLPYIRLFNGSDDSEELWRTCVQHTEEEMGFAVGAMFVRQNFNEKSKPLAKAMISSVKQAFKDNLDNLDWMDDETRRAAREKVDAITDMIGYPKFISNPKELDAYYQELKIESNDYFMDNILKAGEFSFRQNLLQLNKSVTKTMWDMTPSTKDAYYSPTKNQIVFPAGILQPPYFHISYPSALNFAAIGAVMGHELTHAFDDQGREFDSNGELTQWWSNEIISRFQEKADCFVTQYSSFSFNSKSITSGNLTLGENIADNGGLKAAFRAFTNWTEFHGELHLPGLDVSQEQLFFLSFAQPWCPFITKQSGLRLFIDVHSPARYRVMGPLSNMPEFSSVFHCPVGSPMNPEEKCEIW